MKAIAWLVIMLVGVPTLYLCMVISMASEWLGCAVANPNYQEIEMRRSINDRWISGVCGAIAERYKIRSMAVRLGFAAAAWFFGLGLLTYIALWIILPSE